MSEEPDLLIHPVPWQPRESGPALRRTPQRRWPRGAWAAALVVVPAAAFLLAARAVEVDVQPPPDALTVRGGLPFTLRGAHLLLPGTYTVAAEKAGYHRLEASLAVTGAPRQVARFTLTRLPGLLEIEAAPAQGVSVRIDGQDRGRTPLGPLEVEEGDREIVLQAEGYAPFTTRLNVRGGGESQKMTAALTLDQARVSFTSDPPGARVRVDGAEVGATPLTVALTSGERRAQIALEGFRPEERRLRVIVDQALTVPLVRLTPLPGRLDVSSEPTGAAVSVDGRFRGETPLRLEVPAGVPLKVRATKAGHAAAEAAVTLSRGEAQPLSLTLEPEIGEVTVAAEPADAELFVDGQPRGRAGQTLRLTAAPHAIEVRRAGFEPHRVTVTPRPGFPQSVRARLQGEKSSAARTLAETLRPAGGPELRLVGGGRFQMGASRREPGRRANEALREVELKRPFYLAVREITNAQFRRFKADHASGRLGAHDLGGPENPVVNVTWEMAAEYCNWLSAQEGLPPVYAVREGGLGSAVPLSTGYRLPTEAEWSRAARYAPDGPLRFSWGPALPAPPKAGNFADESARSLVAVVLQGYEDRYPATAPVGSFPPNGLGLFDLAGNVAEWVHDVYAIPALEAPGAAPATDPTGPGTGDLHVILGSSFLHGSVSELRLSYRDHGTKPRPDVGFRVARYAE